MLTLIGITDQHFCTRSTNHSSPKYGEIGVPRTQRVAKQSIDFLPVF